MEARILNPAQFMPESTTAIKTLMGAIYQGGIPKKTLELVHLRVSQINGCSVCVDMGAQAAKSSNDADQRRLFTVAAWREAPWFSDAERAALALAEALTRLNDRPDPVPDAIWNVAAQHYDQKELTTLLLHISITNLFNRMNVATRQIAGAVQY